VMNYPQKNAILAYAKGEDDGQGLRNTMESLLENYPKDVLDCCMSLLSTHDTARVLTVLGGGGEGDRAAQAAFQLTPEQRKTAMEKMKLATFLQFTLPGAPSVYYGDETGLEGGKDPFNRKCYPWGRENPAMMRHFRALCDLRRNEQALRTGSLSIFEAGNGRFGFRRDDLIICCNRGKSPWEMGEMEVLMGCNVELTGGFVTVCEGGYAVMRKKTDLPA